MEQLRIGLVAQLLGVSVDTVRNWVDSEKIKASRTPSGHREIDPQSLATFLKLQLASTQDQSPNISNGSKRPANMAGNSMSKSWPASSARNKFRGIVTEVKKDGVMASVELVAGSFRVVSLMSREACEELGLEVGVIALASVKATNVTVEVATESER